MSIIKFWKSNPDFWIPITENEKRVADRVIYERYYDYDISGESLFCKVIYLDQFYRHFHRYLGINDETIILDKRNECIKYVLDNQDLLINADEIELVFALMPFKHIARWDFIFDIIYNKWNNNSKSIKEYPILSKFHNDTYKKAYTLDKISNDIKTAADSLAKYNKDNICDYYPERYVNGDFGKCVLSESIKYILDTMDMDDPIVSLSGGVDSMVMLALLKLSGKHPVAVHIIYGNREVSREEFNFISSYCHRLRVPLYYYEVEFLKRGNVDRDFYEWMTREIRFNVYKAVSKRDSLVLLGHIRDDVIENIWSNLAKCQHLDNLKKMSITEIQNGVRIMRPFLEIDKSVIYRLSNEMAIPYLKNTTPSWSNRGKFRDRFYLETHKQFGESVDDKLISLSEILEKQSKILERMIYKPIYESFNGNSINITPAVIGKIDKGGWITIFEYVLHNLIGCSRPSIHAVGEFMKRLERAIDKNIIQSKIQLKNDFQIILEMKDNKWFINFIK